MQVRIHTAMLLAVALALLSSAGRAETPAETIASFAAKDYNDGWVKDRPYMRALGGDAWKTRMLAMRTLVAGGKDSVPALLEATKSDNDSLRIFAAQTLSYLAPHAPRERLLEIAQTDPNPAVRLYAVDAIGMQGGQDPSADLDPLKKTEKNKDVLKHIGYALERKEQGVTDAVIRSLTDWNPKKIDSAVVGELAPDFQMSTPTGDVVRLADFRGKQPVVLVFIYGDT